jgi:hypothetical protein
VFRRWANIHPLITLIGALVWSVWDVRIPFLLAFLAQASFGFHVRPRVNESASTDSSSPTTPGTRRATASAMTSAGSSPPLKT